jgi:hypothetical protein
MTSRNAPTGIRFSSETRRNLDFLVGYYGESMSAVISRLADRDVQRIKAEDKQQQPRDGADLAAIWKGEQ